MDKHDFSYVLFTAAFGAFGVFLIVGLALEDRVLLIFSGLCLGLALIASIVYMIHLARGPKYEPRLNENGDIISIWCLRCMKSNDPTHSRCKSCRRPINNEIRLTSKKTPEEVAALGATSHAERRFLKWLFLAFSISLEQCVYLSEGRG